jgi:tetratricopeptide (TPR) repeat protein
VYNQDDEMSRAQTLAKARAQSRKRQQPKTPPGTGSFLTGKRLNVILCVLLAAVTIALYSPVAGYAFLTFDDSDYVAANPHIHGGLDTITWAFTSTAASNWHPLTWLSHALDYQIFGLNPAGHYLDSVLIHTLNATLLFLLLRWATKRVGPSLLVAALFAVHPINVESVAWVAERKNVLSTLFFLLAIGAYVWYAQKSDWRRYLLVAALFAAGLMAKPMVITLPFVLLLLDYWPLDRMRLDGTESSPATANGVRRLGCSRLLLEKIPLLFLSAASASITLIAQRAQEGTFAAFPLAMRAENALVSYGLYLWKMLWPARLALYPHSVTAIPAWQRILSALVLITVTAFVVSLRRKRYLSIGWFWFLGTLVPVIGLVQVGEYAMADRYAYVPLIGIFVMIAWGLDDWAEAKKVRTIWRAIPALCALAALACTTNRQMSYWESDYDLWSHTLEGPENPLAHNALAGALMRPDLAMTQHDRENVGTEQNRLDEARHHLERALELRQPLAKQNPGAYLPDMARNLINLGALDRDQNRLDEARHHWEGALAICRQLAQQNTTYLMVTLNLISLDLLENRTEECREHYEEALKIYRQLAQRDPGLYLPDMAGTLINLGNLERSQKQPDKAGLHFEEALKIDRQLAQQDSDKYLPDVASKLVNLGNFETEQNRMDEARPHYEEALEIYRQLAQQDPGKYLPDVAGTLSNLAVVEESQQRMGESRVHYAEAMTIFRRLAQGDPARYAGDVARVEASLQELGKKVPSR